MQLGQSRTLPVEKPEQIDLAQAARYFGARGEADTATMALLQRCAVPLLAAATPRAVWLRAEVKALAEAGILRGSDVMRHLEGCGQAILLAVRAGVDILVFGNNLQWDPDLPEKAHAALRRLVDSGKITPERIRASWERIAALHAAYAR